MITIYEQGHNNYESMGLGEIFPASCVVRQEQGGAYELELTHPMDAALKYDLLAPGRVLKVEVPAQTTPMLRVKGVAAQEYWKGSIHKTLYSKKSTNTGYTQTVTKTKKNAPPKAELKTVVYQPLDKPLAPATWITGAGAGARRSPPRR